MIIGSHKRLIVYNKTNKRCSICGSPNNLTCVCFIPEWTRIVTGEVENMIPLCDECRFNRGLNFIEIGSLQYLPEIHIQQLLRYYKSVALYLHKYLRMFGEQRLGNKDLVKRNILILESYDNLILEKKEELNWEDL